MKAKDKKDFDKFINSPATFISCKKMIRDGIRHFKQLAGMSYAMELKNLDANHQRAIKDSLAYFENDIIAIQRAANMDVEKEQKILSYMDCEGMVVLCENFGKLAQDEKHFVANKPLPNWEPGVKEIPLKDKNRFERHYIYGRTIKIGDKDVFVTIENTTSPSDKIFFQSKASMGAIGIYDSEEKCIKQYQEDDNIIRPNRRACEEIHNYYFRVSAKDEFFNEPKVANSTKYLYCKMAAEGAKHKNSNLFTNVLKHLEVLKEMEDTLASNPEKKDELIPDMELMYESLTTCTQKYINERKGAITPSGKRRLEMMQNILDHSNRKIESFSNVLKTPNPENMILAYNEEEKNKLIDEYKEDDLKLKKNLEAEKNQEPMTLIS